MNAWLTQPIRKQFGITWQEEYILGMVGDTEYISVTVILDRANEVITQATTHKYLTQLIKKNLLKHKVNPYGDRRIKLVTLTGKGVKFLNTLNNLEKLS